MKLRFVAYNNSGFKIIGDGNVCLGHIIQDTDYVFYSYTQRIKIDELEQITAKLRELNKLKSELFNVNIDSEGLTISLEFKIGDVWVGTLEKFADKWFLVSIGTNIGLDSMHLNEISRLIQIIVLGY